MEITGKLQEDTESAACTHNVDAEQVMGAFGACKQITPNATTFPLQWSKLTFWTTCFSGI